jgi:hypothetical protein
MTLEVIEKWFGEYSLEFTGDESSLELTGTGERVLGERGVDGGRGWGVGYCFDFYHRGIFGFCL